MPMSGDPWIFSCSLNLASCRQRAESLARQWQANLWSPRSSFSSDGGSRSVSPSLGFYTSGISVVDRPPPRFGEKLLLHHHMSSLDDDDEDPLSLDPGGVIDVVVTPSDEMSPPSRSEATRVRENGELYCADSKGASRVWMPESPSESFGSEYLPSDSPALTVETEERSSSTASNSTDTVSELASPTDELLDIEKGITLADELCSRLRQFESLQQVNGLPTFIQYSEEPADETSVASTVVPQEEEESVPRPELNLLSPEACPRLVRSTSLKTGKTPPGTPNRKKIVRFADALGLDLEAVRHFVEDEDMPHVPQSAFADLKVTPPAPLSWNTLPGQSGASYQLVPQFQQPAADMFFLDRVRQNKVALENIVVSDLRLTAVVRVLNLGFEKKVFVRYSTTEWAVYTDMETDYVQHSCDGFSDKFSFILHLPHLFAGQRLVFALKYVANGQEFWDNNNGENYALKVQNKSNNIDTSVPGQRWLHHFM